ncbi:MAG: hypothetical protein AAF429_14440 [Pseudomonadota bacterium]
MIKGAILDLLGIGGRVLEAKAEAKVTGIRVEAKLREKMADQEGDWDASALQDVRRSWKDEFWTILLAVPLIESYLSDGWDGLRDAPDWYVYALFMALSLAFARKSGLGDLMRRFKKN